MRNVSFFLVAVILISCGRGSDKKAAIVSRKIPEELVVDCTGIGILKLSDTYADIEKKVGKRAMTEHENTVTGIYTSVWENDIKQINIYWKERARPFSTIRYMEAVNPNAEYMTADSIYIGMNVRDLVEKNGNLALSFNNFNASENSGLITSFNGGEIGIRNPCFNGVLENVSQTNVYKRDLDDFNRKAVVHSYDKVLQKMEVILSTIRLNAKQ